MEGYCRRMASARASTVPRPQPSSAIFRLMRSPMHPTRADPRLSIQERYSTRQVYLEKHAEAIKRLQEDRFLLEEDAVKMLDRATSAEER